jgi:hypothetical protein
MGGSNPRMVVPPEQDRETIGSQNNQRSPNCRSHKRIALRPIAEVAKKTSRPTIDHLSHGSAMNLAGHRDALSVNPEFYAQSRTIVSHVLVQVVPVRSKIESREPSPATSAAPSREDRPRTRVRLSFDEVQPVHGTQTLAPLRRL